MNCTTTTTTQHYNTTTTLCTLLSQAKDPALSVQRNNIVYKYDCKDCEAVYFGQSKRLLAERTKEHTRAVRTAVTRRYETADHCWKYHHDFHWENKKIMDYGINTTTRKIKETIHLLSNNNLINGISYTLCKIFEMVLFNRLEKLMKVYSLTCSLALNKVLDILKCHHLLSWKQLFTC